MPIVFRSLLQYIGKVYLIHGKFKIICCGNFVIELFSKFFLHGLIIRYHMCKHYYRYKIHNFYYNLTISTPLKFCFFC